MSSPAAPDPAAQVLVFWFETARPAQWFGKDSGFDALVRQRFGVLTGRALAGDLKGWEREPDPALALVLLLDQFPRQLWRGQARSFAGDADALALAQAALAAGWIEAEPDPRRRQFWLMPLMHSEERTVQERATSLFERFCGADSAEFARRHRDVIARFGRFPHRNAALGRPGTEEERRFLEQPGSGF